MVAVSAAKFRCEPCGMEVDNPETHIEYAHREQIDVILAGTRQRLIAALADELRASDGSCVVSENALVGPVSSVDADALVSDAAKA